MEESQMEVDLLPSGTGMELSNSNYETPSQKFRFSIDNKSINDHDFLTTDHAEFMSPLTTTNSHTPSLNSISTQPSFFSANQYFDTNTRYDNGLINRYDTNRNSLSSFIDSRNLFAGVDSRNFDRTDSRNYLERVDNGRVSKRFDIANMIPFIKTGSRVKGDVPNPEFSSFDIDLNGNNDGGVNYNGNVVDNGFNEFGNSNNNSNGGYNNVDSGSNNGFVSQNGFTNGGSTDFSIINGMKMSNNVGFDGVKMNNGVSGNFNSDLGLKDGLIKARGFNEDVNLYQGNTFNLNAANKNEITNDDLSGFGDFNTNFTDFTDFNDLNEKNNLGLFNETSNLNDFNAASTFNHNRDGKLNTDFNGTNMSDRFNNNHNFDGSNGMNRLGNNAYDFSNTEDFHEFNGKVSDNRPNNIDENISYIDFNGKLINYNKSNYNDLIERSSNFNINPTQPTPSFNVTSPKLSSFNITSPAKPKGGLRSIFKTKDDADNDDVDLKHMKNAESNKLEQGLKKPFSVDQTTRRLKRSIFNRFTKVKEDDEFVDNNVMNDMNNLSNNSIPSQPSNSIFNRFKKDDETSEIGPNPLAANGYHTNTSIFNRFRKDEEAMTENGPNNTTPNANNVNTNTSIFNLFKKDGDTAPENGQNNMVNGTANQALNTNTSIFNRFKKDEEVKKEPIVKVEKDESFEHDDSMNMDSQADLELINLNSSAPNYGALFENVGKRKMVNRKKIKTRPDQAVSDGSNQNSIKVKSEPGVEESNSIAGTSINAASSLSSSNASSSSLFRNDTYQSHTDDDLLSNTFVSASKRILGSKLTSKRKTTGEEVEVDLSSLDLPPDTKIFPTSIINSKNRTRGRKENKQADMENLAKIYLCNYCSRRFKRQEHLKRHFRSLHTFEKPYECTLCMKKFSRSDNLNQHLKIHKMEEEERLAAMN